MTIEKRLLLATTAFVLMSGALVSGEACAADQPRYAPPAAWVKPLAIPDAPASTDGSAVQVLLEDTQARLDDGEEVYGEAAIRILKPEGLAALANISRSWVPDTQTLTIHRLNIIRDGKSIDQLAGGKNVTVLRRETNLERSTLDGTLTATVQPEGLQVGDIVDLAFTIAHHDPVYQGRSEGGGIWQFPGVAAHVRVRALWPDAKPMRWRASTGLPAPVIAHANGGTELVVEQTDTQAPKPPRDAPFRFQYLGVLELSQFASWSDVSAISAPLYAQAEGLSPDSPLRAEADKIRRSSADPKVRAETALRLVQDQVHYVLLAMNANFVPAKADLTWSRRFGDCKGKTVLLLALLHELGIQAEPALVNTQAGDGMDERLPMLGVFDHVLVRATIAGKTYWLDGTRIGDRDLDDIPLPDVHWALPVRAVGAQLEKVEPKPYEVPAFESLERLDASAGYDSPAPAHAEQVYRGDSALAWHLSLDSVGRADAERQVREHWRSDISWIEPKTVDFSYDDAHHLMRLTMDGVATMDWTKNAGVRDFQIVDSNLGFTTSFKREPGPNADAPFAVAYPANNKWTVIITLPNMGADFRLVNASDVDQTIAGRRYERQSRIDNGVATMVAEEQSLASEFPFAQAEAASVALRDINAWDVLVRGPGTPDTADAGDDELTVQPVDARGFSRRGVAFLMRRDYGRAIADFSEAARLEPQQGKHFYDRGAARFDNGQDDLALQDFNKALELNSSDTMALMARAEVFLAKGDVSRANKDFDQALTLSPGDDQLLARRALADDKAGQYDAAVRAYDAAIARMANHTRLAPLLNARCWVRAEWGRELDQALADCAAALALEPEAPGILDSQGFVELRLGRYDKAIGDYDEALRLSPNLATSLFGRGVAKTREGQAAEGAADIAAAVAASAGVEAQFARYGIKRQGL